MLGFIEKIKLFSAVEEGYVLHVGVHARLQYHAWVHICVRINHLSPPPSLPGGFWRLSREPHQPSPFDGDVRDSWLLKAVCFHYASTVARWSFITATCTVSTFGPEEKERILRRERVFFWH